MYDITGGCVEYLRLLGALPVLLRLLRNHHVVTRLGRGAATRWWGANTNCGRASAVNVSPALRERRAPRSGAARRQKYAQVTGHVLARLGPPCLLRNLSRVRAVQYSTSLSLHPLHILSTLLILQILCSTLSGLSQNIHFHLHFTLPSYSSALLKEFFSPTNMYVGFLLNLFSIYPLILILILEHLKTSIFIFTLRNLRILLLYLRVIFYH